MSKTFKKFLQEMIQFDFGVHYVDQDGEDKSITIKATTQNDALNKFKANDKVKGYKQILQVRKGGVVPPNEVNEDLKTSLIATKGLTHSSHDVWKDSSGNQFKWNGSNFIPFSDEDKQKNKEYVMKAYPTAQLYSSYDGFQIIYPKQGKSKNQKYLSIGKGKTSEEAWNAAKIYVDLTKESIPSNDPNLNKNIIDRIEKIKAEGNWDSWGSIQKSQVEKFIQKLSFDSNDIGTRIKTKEISKWDDLLDIIKKSKLKIGFNG